MTFRQSLGKFMRASGRTAVVRDVLFAGIAVIIVIGSIFTYSSTWPPMVVIESGSMMHAKTDSGLGIIDTGDLTLVKEVNSVREVVTYFQGVKNGHQTYGNFGDVIIYARNGHREGTPIIHRAMTWLQYNHSGAPIAGGQPPSAVNSTWDLPDIDIYNITVSAAPLPHRVVEIGTIQTWHTGEKTEMILSIDLTQAVLNMGPCQHSGFITKGDNNPGPDESPGGGGSGLTGPPPADCDPHGGSTNLQPVRLEWVVGRAEFELPWFGVIKLYAGHAPCPPTCIPGNSVRNLFIAVAAILLGPYAIEKTWGAYGERITSRIPQSTRDKWHRAWDKLPGGPGRAKRRAERAGQREEERKKRGGRRQGGRAR
jgi:signal peptidase